MIIQSPFSFYQRLLGKLHKQNPVVRNPNLAQSFSNLSGATGQRIRKENTLQEYSLWQWPLMAFKLQLMASFGKENASDKLYKKTLRKQYKKGLPLRMIPGPISYPKYLFDSFRMKIIDWYMDYRAPRNNERLENLAESDSHSYPFFIPSIDQLFSLETGYDKYKLINPLKWFEFLYAGIVDSFARRIVTFASVLPAMIVYIFETFSHEVTAFLYVIFNDTNNIFIKGLAGVALLVSGVISFVASIANLTVGATFAVAHITAMGVFTFARNAINMITSPINGFYRAYIKNFNNHDTLTSFLWAVPSAYLLALTSAVVASSFGSNFLMAALGPVLVAPALLAAINPVIAIPLLVVATICLPIVIANAGVSWLEEIKSIVSQIEASEIFNPLKGLKEKMAAYDENQQVSQEEESIAEQTYVPTTDKRLLELFKVDTSNGPNKQVSSDGEINNAIKEKCFSQLWIPANDTDRSVKLDSGPSQEFAAGVGNSGGNSPV